MKSCPSLKQIFIVLTATLVVIVNSSPFLLNSTDGFVLSKSFLKNAFKSGSTIFSLDDPRRVHGSEELLVAFALLMLKDTNSKLHHNRMLFSENVKMPSTADKCSNCFVTQSSSVEYEQGPVDRQ